MSLDATALGLTVALMFLMVMLLVGVIHSRLHWILKAIMIGVSLLVAGVSYGTYVRSMGYAVVDDPPELLQLLGAAVREPKQDDPGAIYIWYRSDNAMDPRSIILPYSKDLHKLINKAKGMMSKGQSVFMQGDKKAPKEPKVKGDGNSAESKNILDFVPPPRTLPEKNPQIDG